MINTLPCIGNKKQIARTNKAQFHLRQRYSPIFILCASLIATQLSACSSLPSAQSANSVAPTVNQTGSQADNQARSYQAHLQLSGRLTIRYFEHDKEQPISVSYEWQQDPGNTEITLISPTGQILAKVEQNASGARLQQANQAPRYAADIEALLHSQLGWSLPVAGLRDWLQGYTKNAQQTYLPVPAEDDARLNVDGWQLRYVSWAREQVTPHPKRIDLYRNDSQAGEITIKILIDQWTTP